MICVLNGAAGSHRALQAREKLPELFTRHGREIRLLVAKNGTELESLTREAIAEGATCIVAGGGDGTIGAVASALVGTEIVLGVLPLGTLNHFAKDLNIPLALEDAVANLFNGKTEQIDVGEVNGRVFLNNSSLGVYPWIVRQRESQQRRGHGKWAAFARALFMLRRHYAPIEVALHRDDQTETRDRTPFVFIGNNKYTTSGFSLGHRAALDGGRLWVCRAPSVSRGKLLRMALLGLIGVPPADLATFEAEEFRLHLRRPGVHVATDGEVSFMSTPLHYRSRPRALHVIVPQRET